MNLIENNIKDQYKNKDTINYIEYYNDETKIQDRERISIRTITVTHQCEEKKVYILWYKAWEL